MEEFVIDKVDKYFNILNNNGYCNYIDLLPIFALLFIEEMINSEFVFYMNNNDINEINKTISILKNNNKIIGD